MSERRLITCRICKRSKPHAAKRLCKPCYIRTATPLVQCKGCSMTKNHHAKGYCSYCYNKEFHTEYFRLASRRLNTGITKDVFDKLPKKCQICEFDKIIDVHHLTPRSKGGNNERSNLVVLCPNHHKMCHHADFAEEIRKKLVNPNPA